MSQNVSYPKYILDMSYVHHWLRVMYFESDKSLVASKNDFRISTNSYNKLKKNSFH